MTTPMSGSVPEGELYEPGQTYGYGDGAGWQFRCDVVTTHPENGERVALGWRFHGGSWEPYAYCPHDVDIRRSRP